MGDDLHINKQTNIFIANHKRLLRQNNLQEKRFHLQIKAEQKEIIQNVLERKDSMAE
jgi:hypothetical protein